MKIDFKKLGIIGSILVSGLLVTSCLDDDSIPSTQNSGWLAFVNASPDSQSLKFYTNGNVINTSGIPYGEFFGYLSAREGNHNLTVKSATSENLDTLSLNVQSGKFYSIFAVNNYDNLEIIGYEDNFITVPNGKAGVRFSQLSPDAPTLKIVVEGEESPIGVLSFKQNTEVKLVNSGIDKKFHLIDSSTSDTLFTKQITLQNGRTYAVFSKGFVNTSTTNQQLNIQAIPFN